MTDVLDRVRKLVALAAGNENRGEAANAAIKACELIKLHGIQLVAKVEAPRSRPPGGPFSGTHSNRTTAAPPGWSDFEEVLRRDSPYSGTKRPVEHVDFTVQVEYGTLHCSIREPKDGVEWRAFKEAYQAFNELWNGWAYKTLDKGCLMEFEAELLRRLGDVGKRHGVWFRVLVRG